jgi:hypothetical protein
MKKVRVSEADIGLMELVIEGENSLPKVGRERERMASRIV